MTVLADAEWSLTDEQRQETVHRVQTNISSIAFFRNAAIPEDIAEQAAIWCEKKAYTVAKVEARVTTGFRPNHETLKAYIR